MAPQAKAVEPSADSKDKQPEENTEIDVDDETESSEIGDEDEDAGSSSQGDSQATDGAGGKKKKKKKKSKKKKSGAASAGNEGGYSGNSSDATNKAENEKRFNAGLQAVRSGADMWIKLPSSSVIDSKAKKLFEALKANSTVTSVDLSQNQIGDEGAQAIASVLGVNGAPELIELDLRDNPLTAQGLTVLEGLKKIRKQLEIRTGSMKEAEIEAQKKDTPKKDMRDLTKGPMFRKYFQSGADEEDDPSTSSYDTAMTDAGVNPDELWAKLDSLVEKGQDSIPELAVTLQQLSQLLQREISTIQSQHMDAMDGSRPHIKACLMHLSTLEDILTMVPPPVTVQYSSEARPAVGSHRMWAADAIAALLSAGNSIIDRLVAAAQLAPQVIHLGLHHPLNSTMQTRALRILKSCCSSPVAELAQPLFASGWGCSLVQPGEDKPCAPLHEQLADTCTAAVDILSGKRSPVMGFAIEACKVLAACCDDAQDTLNASIRRALRASSKWSEFAAADGTFSKLCQAQEGDLGGPRAVRSAVDGGSGLAELAGGGLMNGHEILALLQGMSVMS